MEKSIEDKYRSSIRFLIVDVTDYDRVEMVMEDIDVVFNLAAMKHVPSCEYNTDEAIKTNVMGMENVIKADRCHNVDSVVFTSSDKDISPTNYIFFLAYNKRYILVAIFFQLYELIDNVDGSLARYKNMNSKLGAKLDTISDFIFYNFIYIFIGFNNVDYKFIVLVIVFINIYSS